MLFACHVDVLRRLARAARIVDEGLIKLDAEDGWLELLAVDPAHVLMRNALYQADHQHLTVHRSAKLGVSFEHLKELSMDLEDDDWLVFELLEDGKLRMVWGHCYRERMDLVPFGEVADPKPPKLKEAGRFVVPHRELMRFWRKASIISNVLSFTGSENGLILETWGKEEGRGFESVLNHIEIEFDASVHGEVLRSLYSEDCFHITLMQFMEGDDIALHFGQDYPLVAEARVFGGFDRVLQAPRLERD